MFFFTGKFRAYKQITNILPKFGSGRKHCHLHSHNLALRTNVSQTGESSETATRHDSILRTIYPDHQIELEALANQTPIDIQYMLDHLQEPDVTE